MDNTTWRSDRVCARCRGRPGSLLVPHHVCRCLSAFRALVLLLERRLRREAGGVARDLPARSFATPMVGFDRFARDGRSVAAPGGSGCTRDPASAIVQNVFFFFVRALCLRARTASTRFHASRTSPAHGYFTRVNSDSGIISGTVAERGQGDAGAPFSNSSISRAFRC